MASEGESPGSDHRGVKIYTSHDPACDQCRFKKIGCGRELPSCANCIKANVQCIKSNKGKKPNQTIKLVNDIQKVDERLSGVEKSVLQIQECVEELVLKARAAPPGIEEHGSGLSEVAVSAAPSLLHSYHRRGDARTRSESWSTSSTLMSLFEEADNKINRIVDDIRPRASLREAISGTQNQTFPQLDAFFEFKYDTYRALPSIESSSRLDLSNDGTPLLLPPKRLLTTIVGPYFRHISSVVSLLERQTCLDAIEEQYAHEESPENLDPAWVILFNYIILFCFMGQYMPLDRPSSDIDIMSMAQFEMPFVNNVRRSFSVIHRLLFPRLVNVQSLMALTLISQKYFPEQTTRYLLHQTCFVAKSMGLHDESFARDLSIEDVEARRQVFTCLFMVDQDMSMLFGTPPNFHQQHCDVIPPQQATYDSRLRLDASLILGRVYDRLYSAGAARRPLLQRERDIQELLQHLQDFERAVDYIPSEEKDSMDHRAWQFLKLEQKYFLHNTRLMVLRQSSEAHLSQRLWEATECIHTMSKIWAARPTVGGFMVLRRPFQWRPFAPFFEILPTIFTYPIQEGQQDHLHGLQELANMLRFVTSAADIYSHCGRLLAIAEACISIAAEFIDTCLSQGANTKSHAGSRLTQKRKRANSTSGRGVHGGAPHDPGPAADCSLDAQNARTNAHPIHPPRSGSVGLSPALGGFSNQEVQEMLSGWPDEGVPFLEGLFWGDGPDELDG